MRNSSGVASLTVRAGLAVVKHSGSRAVAVQTEEGLRHFHGLGAALLLTLAHVPMAGAGRAVRIDQQQFSRIMSAGAAEFAQGHLKFVGLGDGSAVEQFVDRGVLGQEGQAVERLESAVRQATPRTEPVGTQRGLMEQLQRQPRLDALWGLLRPSPQQVPSSQTQVFRDQQPQASHVVADLIGQPLPDPALDADRIAGGLPDHALSDPRLDLFAFQAWAAPVEFFFAGRSRSARAGRCGC